MIGKSIAHYDVLDLLGKGGMGEVYRARDSRLRREVALKVLPAELSQDRERLLRFQQEARVLATLSHPGIASIFGIESEGPITAAVLELVPGQDLEERLASRPMPLDLALRTALQIVEALQAAHAAGIVHRDLKPANIRITPEGRVKILDFGLAKALSASSPAAGDAATMALETQAGAIMGTPAYMAPEQARGEDVGRQADIWAFACILWKMLTGTTLFGDASIPATLAAVMTRQPDWSTLPPDLPAPALRLLRRCLARDLSDRLQDIGDARLELVDALDAPAEVSQVARRKRPWVQWAAFAVVLALTVVGTAQWSSRDSRTTGSMIAAEISPPTGTTFSRHPTQPGSVTLSRDGRLLAFAAGAAKQPQTLWIRALDGFEPREIEGTEGATLPFFSWDDRRLGYFVEDRLYTISVSGGPPMLIATIQGARGGAWGADDEIYVGTVSDGIQRLPSSGGSSTRIGEGSAYHPSLLPNGDLLYMKRRGPGSEKLIHYVMITPKDGGPPVEVCEAHSPAQFAAGHLWYVLDGILLSHRFDPGTRSFTGSPHPITNEISGSVWSTQLGAPYFAISETGVVAFHKGSPSTPTQLTWIDRHGKTLGTVGAPDDQYQLQLSPDGRSAAVQMVAPNGRDWGIWIHDVERERRHLLSTHAGSDAMPVWSADGTSIAFASTREGGLRVFLQSLEDGTTRRLGRRSAAFLQSSAFPVNWTRDGRQVLVCTYDENVEAGSLWVVPVDTLEAEIELRPADLGVVDAALSPDEKWLAYVSYESGERAVYLADFPQLRQRWPVSGAGGCRPEWNPSGRELFYLSSDDVLHSVSIGIVNNRPDIGDAESLFTMHTERYLDDEPGSYAVGPDGERFLVNLAVEDDFSAPVALIVDWKPSTR